MKGVIDTHQMGNQERQICHSAVRAIAGLIGIAVWLWRCYFFTPLAPFYIGNGRFIDYNDGLRFDTYQLQEDMSISKLTE